MILVLTPDDLYVSSSKKEFKDIDLHDFILDYKPMAQANFIIYIVDKGVWKIFKNRYPDDSEDTRNVLKLFNIYV